MVKIQVTGEKTFDWLEAKYRKESSTSKCRAQDTFYKDCFRGTNVGKDTYNVEKFAAISTSGIPQNTFSK